MTLDLAALLAPAGTAAFFAERWEKAPLHLARADRAYYASVLTTADLEHILSSSDLRYPAVQLARGGGYFPPEVYTRSVKHGSEVFAGVPDLEKVRAEYRAGATIVLPALHRTWAPLRDLCGALERSMGHAVHANAYLTAGNTTGFSPHYDTHEVFVLQVGGTKHWSVYPPPLHLPHRSQPLARSGYTPPAPLFEVDLHPGDLLYLPRGYVHAAATSESFSAHVTVGVTVYTWIELLSEWVQSSKDLVSFREALPPGFAADDSSREALVAGLLERIEALRTGSTGGARTAAVVESFRQRVRAAQPKADTPFDADVSVLGATTAFDVAEPARYTVGEARGNMTLTLDGRTLVLPAGVKGALEAICQRRSFRPGELPRTLDDHAMMAFVQFLETEGFLTRVKRA